MAIYHLRAAMVSRSAGRSATAAAAYRAAERIEDARTGLSFDYRARSGVDHVEIIAPANAPAWAYDRAALWNAVEAAETRKNSQVAREIRVALPAELDHAQRVALVRDFCQREFVARGMVADIALHAPGRDGDDRNHHAHIMLTTREIGPNGFTTKNRAWNAVEVLERWREGWAREANAALERAGLEERVDHRTLEAQRDEALERANAAREKGDTREAMEQAVRAVALDREPLPQLSAGAWQLKERGIEVAAVAAWHEIKARAAEVVQVAQELAGFVRSWWERTADQFMDRGASERGLALAVGDQGHDRPQDLASRLREAWEGRAARSEADAAPTAEREAPQDFADRLRAAAQGVSREDLAEQASALQQYRDIAQERTSAEKERTREQEQEQERYRYRSRDRDFER